MYYGQPGYPYGNPPLPPHQLRKHKHTMTLEGEGQVTVHPDQAQLQIGAATEHLNVQEAQEENARISRQIIEALKGIGISEEDIKTTSYSIYPRYDYVEGKSTLRGYEVVHLLTVTIKDIEQTGTVYDLAVKNGANRSGSIQFTVSNPEIAYQEALTKAVAIAGRKAATLAKTIGATLDPVPVKITERGIQQGPSPRTYAMEVAGASTEAPPIQEGQYTITAAVIAVYAYQA